jgi:hypothetical protein
MGSVADTVRNTLFGRQTNKEDTVNNRDEPAHPQRSTSASASNGDSLSSDTRYDETSGGKYQLNNPSSTMKHSGASDTHGYSGDPPSYDTSTSFGGDSRSDYNKDTSTTSLSGVTSGLDDSSASQHDNQACGLDSGVTSNPSKRTDILPGGLGSTVETAGASHDTRSTDAFDPSNQFEDRDRSTGEYDFPSTSGFSGQQATGRGNAAETDDLSSDLSSDKRPSGPAGGGSRQNFGDSYSQGIPDTGLGDETRENNSNAREGEVDNTNAGDPTSGAPATVGPSAGADPSSGAAPGQKQQGDDRPTEEPPTDDAAGQDGIGRENNVSPRPESQSTKAVDSKLPSLPGSEEGTGTQYVKSSGMAADGGDFDASAPGAGREAE